MIVAPFSSSNIYPEAKYHLPAHPNNLHTKFDASIPPALKIKENELIHVQTIDCFSRLVTPKSPFPELLDRSQLNPVTGPLYIEGCEPGDLLAVTLHDIRPKGTGVACCGCLSGQLCHFMKRNNRTKESYTKFFDLVKFTESNNSKINGSTTTTDGCTMVVMREDDENDDDDEERKHQELIIEKKKRALVSFPLRPMLGVIGVAPRSPISTMPAGTHGGNLDNKLNGIGSTIYIPVNHKGGLLSIGDMHASQGDGEIAGTGVEIGGDVLLSCRVLPQKQVYGHLLAPTTPSPTPETHKEKKKSNNSIDYETMSNNNDNTMICNFPITETKTHFVTHGVLVEDIPHCTNIACEEAAKLLCGQWNFTPEEAFIFLSVRGDLGLCQSCHPDQGTQIARMVIPKLDACPKPFRCLL